MKIRLDRTVCDGFGVCVKHAPGYFSLDDWGYASLIGDGTVPEEDRDAVDAGVAGLPRARHHRARRAQTRSRASIFEQLRDPAEHLHTESNEAEWGFTR